MRRGSGQASRTGRQGRLRRSVSAALHLGLVQARKQTLSDTWMTMSAMMAHRVGETSTSRSPLMRKTMTHCQGKPFATDMASSSWTDYCMVMDL